MIANAETPERSYKIIDLRAAGDGWNDAPSRGPAGVRITPETALQCSAVLACVRLIAENIATVPLHLYRRLPGGGKERARDLPLYKLLNQQPNSWQTSFEFRETLSAHCLVYGNAYALQVPGALGAVTELHPLHPSRMKVEQLEDGTLRYCYREANGRETVYRQDQIFHLRWLSGDGVTGMMPVSLSRDAIALAQALEAHGGAYFGNACRLSGLLLPENPISNENAERLREQFERMHRGPDRAFRTAVLPPNTKWQDIQSSNEASQFLETRQYQVIEVCRAYRVDPSYIQDKTKVGYASQEQAAIDLVQQTLLPWFRRWESAITRDLVADDDTYFAEFDVRGLLRGDSAAQAAWFQWGLNAGIYTINEVRELLNLNPIGAEGDERYMQLNMTTLTGINEQVEAEPAPVDPPASLPAGDGGESQSDAAAAVVDQGVSVQDTALNGAQVSALLEILQNVAAGVVSGEGAVTLIVSAFPGVSEQQAAEMVAGVRIGSTAPSADVPVGDAVPRARKPRAPRKKK